MIREWLERRKERRAMKFIEESVALGMRVRKECLDIARYLDAETPEQLIDYSEQIREYIEKGK
jgi:hypothetical protein